MKNKIKKIYCLNMIDYFSCVSAALVLGILMSSVQILFCTHEVRARLEVSRASIINENKWLGCCVSIDVELLDV